MSASTPITLSIAGSDSGGGAGIQADIKAISATGGYACTAITALTAQNTLGVQAIHAVPPAFIRQQLDSVFSDLDVRAVKVGMLGDVATIRCVAEAVRDYQPPAVIVDPVMVATSGDVLLEPAAVSSLRDELLPLADLITPNLYEAQVLLGQRGAPLPETEAELRVMA
ncbi:MAG TPA: bifunctional hydroxymethylpyrimidine kinase/phosphomethylpyrimidine kinase, partial [Gammaproteobacteria bacterium]|nr:bifunctional hydroxymethylpyrimidine kinase/phosphomethylpyrimidine kinase [Gammaproteobacteria bacterium]